MTLHISRRAAMQVVAGLTVTLAGCASATTVTNSLSAPATPGRRTLVAFFSRAGENYHYGGRIDLDVGNTEVVAGMIRDRIGAEFYKIEAADPYPNSYDEAVARNRDEQERKVRPNIAGALPDTAPYDVVILASPVWSGGAPRIMSTLIDGIDLRGKTVLPVVTYAVSGMSGVEDFYREALSGATVERGLAVRGEVVRESGAAIDSWLREHNLVS
jgi:flavodoxin